MDFDSTSRLFKDLFEPIIKNGKATPKTYIYVFSKVIDDRTFYKIGEGKRTISRVISAQTYLIRFKVEYLIFYEQSPYPEEYNTQMEKLIHKVFRHKYDSYVLDFKSGNPSEWYLPPKSKTREFFQDFLGLIGVVRPKPIEAYKFTSTSMTDIMRSLKSTRSYEKYAADLDKQLKEIKEQKKMKTEERKLTIGNKSYLEDRLVGHIFRDEGRVWVVLDVEYKIGLKAYVVGYRPQRITKNSSAQDLQGYETRLEEFFDMIGEKEASKLGLKTNYDWYEQQDED